MKTMLFIFTCFVGAVLSACRPFESPIHSTSEEQQPIIVSPTLKSTLSNTQTPTRTVPLASTETSTVTTKSTPKITITATPEVSPTLTITVKKSVPANLDAYIGHIYPPLPEGFSEGGFESLIYRGSDADFADIEHGLQTAHLDQLYLLIFDKLVKREKNVIYWKILDILVLPNLTGEEVFIPAGCLVQEKLDYEIMAVGILDEEAYRTRYLTNEKILQAWRANRLSEAIEPIPVEGIECHSDSAFSW